jgi:uncharacterized membrane protein
VLHFFFFLQWCVSTEEYSYRRWVKNVFPGNNQILVVQTLRNGILTSTYFATSSSTIALFVTTEGINRSGVQQIQLLVLAGVMIAAFINFLLHIRGLNAMSYMAWGVPPPEFEELDPEIGGEVSKRVITSAKITMLRATVHYSIGVKVFILVLIVAGWMINPLGFLIGALLCVLTYVWMDFL